MSNDNVKVVILNIDGAPEGMFYELLDAGRLPNLAAVFKHGARTRGCASVFPSTTVTAQTSLFTGLYPRRHHIFSFRVLHREKNPLRFDCYDDMNAALDYYGVSLFGLPDLILKKARPEGNLGRNMNPDEKTIYHAFARAGKASTVYMHLFGHGAARTVIPSKRAFIQYALAYKHIAGWDKWDSACVDGALADLERRGLPDLSTLYLSGGDAVAHYVGGLKEMRSYLVDVIDPLWGKFQKAAERGAKGADVLWVLTSDHGHIDTPAEDRFAVSPKKLFAAMEDPGGRRVLFDEARPNLDAMNFALFPELGAMYAHIKNEKTGSWADAADFESQILPAAHGLWGTMKKLGRHAEAVLVKREAEGAYFALEPDAGNKLSRLEDYFAGREARYPLAARRMAGFYGQRSPEVVLLPDEEKGWHYSAKPMHSIHGSLEARSSLVPMIFAGPGVRPGELPDRDACIVDMPPTLAALAGVPMNGTDGKALAANG